MATHQYSIEQVARIIYHFEELQKIFLSVGNELSAASCEPHIQHYKQAIKDIAPVGISVKVLREISED